jgi:hypothetical protein
MRENGRRNPTGFSKADTGGKTISLSTDIAHAGISAMPFKLTRQEKRSLSVMALVLLICLIGYLVF